MKKNLKLFISSALVALLFSTLQTARSMEEDTPPPYVDPQNNTLIQRSEEGIQTEGHNRQASGCERQGEAKIPLEFPLAVQGREAIYLRFLKGALVYRNALGETITFPIARLKNPLDEAFDLSPCGDDISRNLSIATGYRKALNPENANKLEIWLTPRFLVEDNLDGSARHLQPVFDKWDAHNPIGIFWTRGYWEDITLCDYLITESIRELSCGENLYEKYARIEKGCGAAYDRHSDISRVKAFRLRFDWPDSRPE